MMELALAVCLHLKQKCLSINLLHLNEFAAVTQCLVSRVQRWVWVEAEGARKCVMFHV